MCILNYRFFQMIAIKKQHRFRAKKCQFQRLFREASLSPKCLGIIQVESSVRQLIKDTPKGNIVGRIRGDGDRSPKNKPRSHV